MTADSLARLSTDALARLATEAIKESKHWPTKWCAEMTDESMNYDGQPPFFRCWSADGRDGATQEMALGSEDYDDKLATFIALLANSTPQLARGYLEAQETLRKQTLLWRALGDNTSEVEDLTRDRDEYKQKHGNALASWAVDRKNLEDAAHRSRCDLLDAQTEIARLKMELRCAEIQVEDRGNSYLDLTRQLAEARAEIDRMKINSDVEFANLTREVFAERDVAVKALRYLRRKIDGYDSTFEHSGFPEFKEES